MRITAEMSLYPMQSDPIARILQFIDAVQGSDRVEIAVNQMSTQIRGELEDVMQVIANALRGIVRGGRPAGARHEVPQCRSADRGAARSWATLISLLRRSQRSRRCRRSRSAAVGFGVLLSAARDPPEHLVLAGRARERAAVARAVLRGAALHGGRIASVLRRDGASTVGNSGARDVAITRPARPTICRCPYGPSRQHALAIGATLLVSAMFGWFLAAYTDAAFPYLDSFTSIAAIVTTYMVAKKILENWIYWFVIDGIGVYLHAARGPLSLRRAVRLVSVSGRRGLRALASRLARSARPRGRKLSAPDLAVVRSALRRLLPDVTQLSPDLRCERLTGGVEQRSFLVTVAARQYVLRLRADAIVALLDIETEAKVTSAVAAAGLAPRVIAARSREWRAAHRVSAGSHAVDARDGARCGEYR